MQELLWLLLPVAAASGWWWARRETPPEQHRSSTARTAPDYFKGINYLLNEEPDKAIDVFVQLLEVDKETVETHLALGSLFRRRGEVERAIRIHQNLIARPALSVEQRAQALLELGMDYMRAGLYDRAENLFLELRTMGIQERKALENLLIIYQQERDWKACLETAEALEPLTTDSLCLARAHYYCELADDALRKGQHGEAVAWLEQAMQADIHCVRPLHMRAVMARDAGDYKAATRLLRQVVDKDADYLPEVLDDFMQCHARMDDLGSLRAYLQAFLRGKNHAFAALAIAQIIEHMEGREAAAAFLSEQVMRQPSLKGLLRLIELNVPLPKRNFEDILRNMKTHVQQLLAERPTYQCNKCGFAANTLHWQCPSCRSWSSIRRKPELEEKCL